MIKFRDALTLSVTKLKTRRVRLIVTTVISGLFFVLLAFASLVFTGATRSLEDFNEDGFGKRYIAQVSSYSGYADFGFFEDKELIEEAKKADAKLMAEKKAAARKLGVFYDSSTETKSVTPDGGPEGKPYLQPTPHIQNFITEYQINASKSFFDALEAAKDNYKIKDIHYGVSLVGTSGPTSNIGGPTLAVIKEGAELASNDISFGARGFASLSTGLSMLDDSVLNGFLLPNQSLKPGKDTSVPVVAPYSAVEEALGLEPLSSSASSEQKLERLKTIRQKAAGTTFQVCIRNQASLNRQTTAKEQQADYDRNKNKQDYVRPELMYKLSEKVCQDVEVERDVRSAFTKQSDAKQQKFEEMFGKEKPHQRLVTFKIAGITPDPPGFDQGFSVRAIISSIISSNLGSGWFVPRSAVELLPEFNEQIKKSSKIAAYQNQFLVEFETAEEAKRFSKNLTCQPDFFANPGQIHEECEREGTPFSVMSFGSNSVALEDARNWFSNAFINVALVVAALAAFIMMGTIGKVIADSRRETAVFRAIGAKRGDIASIYIIYSIMLGLIVAAFAILVGFLLAAWLNATHSSGVTIDTLTAYNSQNLERRFLLIGVDMSQLLKLSAIILAASLLSAIIPLFNNLKRNPIKDMRDER